MLSFYAWLNDLLVYYRFNSIRGFPIFVQFIVIDKPWIQMFKYQYTIWILGLMVDFSKSEFQISTKIQDFLNLRQLVYSAEYCSQNWEKKKREKKKRKILIS